MNQTGANRKWLVILGVSVALVLLVYWIAGALYQNADDLFQFQLWLTRGFLLALAAFLILHFKNFREQLTGYFNETGSAYNLAIFRIVYYGLVSIGFTAPLYLFGFTTVDFPWSAMPDTARVSLPFMGWYVNNVPINDQLANLSVKLIAISAFFCTIGFRARFFGIIYLVAVFYFNGIPNFFGKVNHNHYIIWFGAIMAFSRSGDVLSVDYLLRKWGILKSKYSLSFHNRKYSLPLKFVGLLIGIIYFFPGFWKLWSCGLDWALTDNVRNQMYFKWVELNGWLPPLRIDYYPLLYKASGLFTVSFELGFIFLIFKKTTRYFALLFGIVFHTFVWFTMHIDFSVLAFCYVALVDWEGLYYKIIGKKRVLIAAQQDGKLAGGSRSVVFYLGWALVIVNTAFGLGKINSWPFSCFPTFDYLIPTEAKTLEYTVKHNGKETKLDKNLLIDKYMPFNYRAWESRVLMHQADKDFEQRDERLKDLALLWKEEDVMKPGDTLRVYLKTLTLSADSFYQSKDNEFLFEMGMTDNEK